MKDFHLLLEPLEQAHARIVAREDPGGPDELRQRRRDLRQPAIGPLRQRLHDQVVAVPIDDQRRQPVRLAVDEPVRRRVERQRLAIGDRRGQAPLDEIGGGRRRAELDHPQGDLGLVAEQRVADRTPALLAHLHEVARRRVGRRSRRSGRSTDVRRARDLLHDG